MTEQEAKELIKYINKEYFYYDKEGEFDEINEALDMVISALEEIQQYRELGTVEELREVMEKQVLRKPQKVLLHHGVGYECEGCGNELSNGIGQYYCHWCGQRLDWE